MSNNAQMDFIKSTERLVNPMSVGALHFIQPFNQTLPKKVQRALINSSAKKTPYMGFVVEPYATFLCYEITDIKKAEQLLPNNFKLIKTHIFEGDQAKYYCIFGCLRLHTSAFWGCRTELYIIAEDQTTGLLSWIIIDYDSDTISYDNKRGLISPTTPGAVITTTYDSDIVVDMRRAGSDQKIIFNANLTSAKRTKLDQRLWLEGNLSIGYGKQLTANNDAGIFSLRFNPQEVTEALKLPQNAITNLQNTWQPGLFAKEPSQIVCFPFSQHFVSDSPGSASHLQNEKQLIDAVKSINFAKVQVFSAAKIQKAIMASSGILFALVIILTIALVLK